MKDEAVSLSELEIKVLNALQQQIPLVKKPYAQIADELATTEAAVLKCVADLAARGIIRRLGASINSRSLGYVSLLAAAKVHPDQVAASAKFINSFAEVTHNYLREGEYNIWFTIIAPARERLQDILSQVEKTAGVEKILGLPAKKTFKINVKFPLGAR